MNNKRILCRAVLTVLTLLWMLLIFMMSGADDDESRAQSGSICRFLCETFVEGFEDLPPEKQLEIEKSLSFPVRKSAHFTEYAILGMLLTLTTAAWLLPGQKDPVHLHAGPPAAGFLSVGAGFILPFLIGVLYAVSDEIHQTFVPGRAGQLRDVLIDSCGVLAGICIIRVLRCFHALRRAGRKAKA